MIIHGRSRGVERSEGTRAAYVQAMARRRAPTEPALPSAAFEQETVRLVSAIRENLGALVRATPVAVTTASEFQRATRLDMKLCWKVFRVVASPDALAGARYVPTRATMRDLLATMRRLGAPEAEVRRAEELADDFERLVAEHAGDRQTFDTMVSAFAAGSEKIDLRERRAAYKATSHIWGVQAEGSVSTLIVRGTSDDPARVDMVGLHAEYGLRRLRRTSVPLYAASLRAYNDPDGEGEADGAGRRLPLHESGSEGIGLIPEFCSKPMPSIVISRREAGASQVALADPGIGIRAAVDIAVGYRMPRAGGRYRSESDPLNLNHILNGLRIPTRVAVLDMILEEGLFPPTVRPMGYVISNYLGLDLHPEDIEQGWHLIDPEPAVALGRGPEVLATGELPRYPELVRWAMDRVGWDASRFTTWRFRVEYPPVMTNLAIVHELPEEPRG